MNNKILISLLMVLLLWHPQDVSSAVPVRPQADSVISFDGEKYCRTELYFGRSIAGGGMVSDEQWKQFLADEVTPRFPDGFSVLSGYGQYRGKTGIISEPNQILIFLYPRKTQKTSHVKIEEIRAAYVKKFNQESVLRLDFKNAVTVAF